MDSLIARQRLLLHVTLLRELCDKAGCGDSAVRDLALGKFRTSRTDGGQFVLTFLEQIFEQRSVPTASIEKVEGYGKNTLLQSPKHVLYCF